MYITSGPLNTGWPIGRLFPGENFLLLSAFLNRLEFLVSNRGSMGFPPSVFVAVSVILVQVWCRQLYWWGFMTIAFLMSLEEAISKPISLFFWLLLSFYLLFWNETWALGVRAVLYLSQVGVGTIQLLFSLFGLVMIFCSDLHLLQQFLWWEVKTLLISGYEDNIYNIVRICAGWVKWWL